jgi:uncharacterized protein YjbJ (UPF0337 family)
MNWDIVEGNWKQFKGKAKEQWGKLTDDDLDVIAGKRDQLAGRVQEAYGVSKDEAEKQIRDFETRTRTGANKLATIGQPAAQEQADMRRAPRPITSHTQEDTMKKSSQP